MRIFNKTVVWLIAVVAIVLFFFGFFGAKSYYGDVSTVIVNGTEQLRMGTGLGKTVTVKLATSTADLVPSGEQLEVCKRVVEQRLATFNLTDYNVYINYDDPSLIVELPYSTNLSTVVSLAGAKGSFAVRRGTEETDASIIFGLGNVKSADVDTTNNSMFTLSSLALSLDSSAKAALKDATKEMAEEFAASETTQKISVWYDGQMLASKDITEVISNGKLNFDMIFNLDSSTAAEMSVMLNSDDIPYNLTSSTITETDYALDGAPRALGIACAAAAVALALYFLVRYRLSGLTAVVALLGTAGSMMAVQTGFFGTSTNPFSFATLSAFVLVILLSADNLLRDCAQIREDCNPHALARSTAEALKRNLGLSMRAYAAALIVGIVLACFSNGLILYTLLQPMFTSMGVNSNLLASVGSFGLTLTWGMIFSMVFCVLGNRLMLSSVFSYDGAKKAGLVGGAAHE